MNIDKASAVPSELPMLEISDNTIDVEEVFENKSPRMAKLIPKFIYKYLRRIIHEKEINEFLRNHKDMQGLDFVAATLDYFNVHIDIVNEQYLRESNRMIVASNHPLGGLDGMALLHVLGKYDNHVITPANDILMFLPNTVDLFVPVNKHGSNVAYAKILDETFKSDKTIMIFPAGLCSRKQKGLIRDTQWKHTFINKAIKYNRLILPVHFSGRNSNFFYNLANIRKFLRIKSNIEMLFLVNEMFKKYNEQMVITLGKPISPEVFDKSRSRLAWAEAVRQYIYRLGNDKTAIFDPHA
ncbi:MAG: 1-acyl-sn-glycerol-3-phosphate acyltransferase [Bacteroidales bacterium]|nr:1-acyl-sn-glycerol-3-phosphate acyltransferase [Bacteroidales bacterium]